MRRVLKYPVDLNSVEDSQHEVFFDVPAGSRPLTVQVQRGVACLWMEVDDKAQVRLRAVSLLVVGTGHGQVPEATPYLCTVQHEGYVWHVYWRTH